MTRAESPLAARLARAVLRVVALFYAYGALVHVLNMLSLTGFHWPSAPLKWQVLDVAYLLLDVVVIAGLLLRWRPGYVAFYLAALSQVVLYTVLRSWILDVPDAFRVSPEQAAYLDWLVGFHGVTLVLVSWALGHGGRTPAR